MRPLFLTIIILLLASPALAQPDANHSVTVVDLAGREYLGTLQQLTKKTLTIDGRTLRRFELDNIVSLRFAKRALPANRSSSLVLLAGGDRIFLQPETIGEDDLSGAWAQFPAWPRLKIPLERVQAIAFHLPDNAPARQRLTASLRAFNDKRDVVILRNGDRLAGALAALSTAALTFDGPVGKLTIPRNNIQALAFNAELTSTPKKTGKRILLELTDGSRLTVRRASLVERGMLEVETGFGNKLRLPTTAIFSMRFLGGRAVYLSDLKSAEYQFTPYLQTRWPLHRDRNVLGGPLRLDGREFAKGLGMHSRSSVSYDLGGKYRQFRATVGIDDSAGDRGSVRFAIETDGKRVFTSELVTGADKPLAIGPIDLSGKQRLTLIVEFGDLGDILDHADWCDPVLIR